MSPLVTELAVTALFTEPSREGDPDWTWMPADPFRAHVRLLSATTGASWPVLAVLARVNLSAVRSLMLGRCGRPVRRIHPRTAVRLFAVGAERVAYARRHQVPAATAVAQLRNLDRLTDLDELAGRLGIRSGEFRALLTNRPETCAQYTAAAVEAAYRQAWQGRARPVTTPAVRAAAA